MKRGHLITGFIFTLGLLLWACDKDKQPAENGCDEYRLRYITDIRYISWVAYTNRYSIGYSDNGKLLTRYTIYNADTAASDYVKLDAEGRPYEFGNVHYPNSPDLRSNYFYQNGRLSKREYWSSTSPGAPIELAETSQNTYTNGLLTQVVYFAPNETTPKAKMDLSYSADANTRSYYYVSLPDMHVLQAYSAHYTALINPLADFETGAGWETNFTLPDTIYADGVPTTILQHDTEDGRVVRTRAYAVGNPVMLVRNIAYEYECY